MNSQYPPIFFEPDQDSSVSRTLPPKPSTPPRADESFSDGHFFSYSDPNPPYFKPSQESLVIGDVLKDRFVLVASLGEGGMGIVFKALDKRKEEAEDSDPYVAIKILKPEMSADPHLFMALQRETKRAQQLSHPNIIQVYDFDRDGKKVFMSMEYLTGQTLSKLIKSAAPMSLAQAWPIIEEMGQALACAHEHNIVHSDFKPSNVFIKDNGTVKVLDFGIASKFNSPDHEDEEKTRYNPRCLGALTEAYASLEMLEGIGSPDPRDDIYAFGCVIYQLLTGKHPFSMLSAKQVHEFNHDPLNRNRKLLPTPITGLNHRQMNALLKALQLKRGLRTKSINELLDNLRNKQYSRQNQFVLGLAIPTILGALLWLNWHLALPPQPTNNKPASNVIDHPAPTQQMVNKKPEKATPAIPEKPKVQHISSSGDGVVKLWSSKPDYKIGQKLQIQFVLSKPMYVKIIHRGAKGVISDLLPNPFQPAKLFKPDKEYGIPPAGAKFSINVEGPVGIDTVTILASTSPIVDKQSFSPNGATLLNLIPGSSWTQISYSVSQ